MQKAETESSILSHKPLNVYEYSYEDMVTSLMLTFLLRDREDFANLIAAIEQLSKELGEDNMCIWIGQERAMNETAEMDSD